MTETALVTGGAGGMGLATAKLLGKTHRVFLADLAQDRVDQAVSELTSLGIDAAGAVADITDPKSVQALFAQASAGQNHIRAVVHTAGISPQMGTAEAVARVNGIGTVNVAHAYLGIVKEGDVLVNVASMGGHGLPGALIPKGAYRKAESDPEGFVKGIVSRSRVAGKKLHSGLAYALSKSFVMWYSRKIAAAFGEHGARALSVSPGSFDTDMGKLEADHGAADQLKTASLKRFGRPEEIAAVLAFCASPEAGYLTGTDVLVDGGVGAGKQKY